MKNHEILILFDIKKHYAINFENRRFIIVVEMINVIDEYLFFSMMIIQKCEIMKNWFSKNMSNEIYIVFSNNDFTFDTIDVEYLQHYIKHSNAESDANWKLMLMNNHESHLIFEFIVLINENHIRSYLLISHMIHCMQFLNVGIFQSFKHWHDKTIQKIIAKSFVEYFLIHFMKNFIKIRNNIFKMIIIRHVFAKSGMWLINAKLCVKQLKIFNLDFSQMNDLLFSLPRQTHSQEISDIEYDLINEWEPKIQKKHAVKWFNSRRWIQFFHY